MAMNKYDVQSPIAAEFINDAEIMATIDYARSHKSDVALIEEILDKASKGGGLNHREATVLLECDDEKVVEQVFALARQLKQRIYGNRIVMFAPLYLSNYCINGCVYCP